MTTLYLGITRLLTKHFVNIEMKCNAVGFNFSISTMLTYLQHFDPNMDIYLGERYGYQLLSSSGFNYITGGGGIVFSLSVIEKLVENCQCPSSSSPDDMIIGLCLQYAGIEPIHSSRFHQVNGKKMFACVIGHSVNLLAAGLLIHRDLSYFNSRHDRLIIRLRCYFIMIQYHFINSGKLIHIMCMKSG